MNPELQQRLEKLEAKYAATGQDWLSYLDGLIYSDYLSYWDYIHLDVLLNLQQPKTKIPDENIFIIYHQITELYFKLVRLELQQIIDMGTAPSAEWFDIRIRRCVRYFEALTKSFAIMSDG
ncbi:MAG: tryptophan 2,3-dioxygenase family protein, partial [Bacteroidia bacterium]